MSNFHRRQWLCLLSKTINILIQPIHEIAVQSRSLSRINTEQIRNSLDVMFVEAYCHNLCTNLMVRFFSAEHWARKTVCFTLWLWSCLPDWIVQQPRGNGAFGNFVVLSTTCSNYRSEKRRWFVVIVILRSARKNWYVPNLRFCFKSLI